MQWLNMSYLYDGSFAGFLTCVYESYIHRELPVCFSRPEDSRISLWPERAVETDRAHAGRVYRSLSFQVARDAQQLVARGFLTCMPDRELHLYDFIRLGYVRGPSVLRDLTDSRVDIVLRAVRHLDNEAHLLKGFVRFSRQDGILVGEIEPKNRALPLLRPHFCTRFSGESFVLYDRTHREALFYQPHQWTIAPLDFFRMDAPDEKERQFRALWRRFYNTIAIEGRYNPSLRRSNMPKRYWATMTEFQSDPPEAGGASSKLPGRTV